VADRLVLAELQPKEIAGVASGDLSFDALVRTYIHQHLTYRYIAFEGLTVTDYHSRVVGRHKRRWVVALGVLKGDFQIGEEPLLPIQPS